MGVGRFERESKRPKERHLNAERVRRCRAETDSNLMNGKLTLTLTNSFSYVRSVSGARVRLRAAALIAPPPGAQNCFRCERARTRSERPIVFVGPVTECAERASERLRLRTSL